MKNMACLMQSERIKRRYLNGWMPKAGRCKKYTYISDVAGKVILDGTWELQAAKYFDKMNFIWERNVSKFDYIDMNGILRQYTPDFWINNWNSFLEIKGFETELDHCKWNQFSHNLIVWKKQDLKERNII